MVILVLEASIRYTHLIHFWLKENTLALIHLRVLLLNNYEISTKYSIYEYPVWRQSRVKQLILEKSRDALRYMCTTLVLKSDYKRSDRLISTKKCHSKG